MSDKMVRRYILTLNNPVETDEEFCKYVENLEHFKYCIFQREKGLQTGTEHFQVFIIFSVGKRFSTIKKYFPTAHIEETKGTNAQCRDYCSKSETRISGPFEIGQFNEERSRTDISNFIECAQLGLSDYELSKLYPKLYLSNLNKINKIRQDYMSNEFLKKNRNVEVIYIYGPPRTGKTRYVYDKYGFGNFYHVSFYNNSTFDNYKGEKILLLDEFTGKIDIGFLNRLLDIYPLNLPARYENKIACYEKVYIISNLPLKELYKEIQENRKTLYDAFNQRIKTIIRIDKNGQFVERENYHDLNNNQIIPLSKKELKENQINISEIFKE